MRRSCKRGMGQIIFGLVPVAFAVASGCEAFQPSLTAPDSHRIASELWAMPRRLNAYSKMKSSMLMSSEVNPDEKNGVFEPNDNDVGVGDASSTKQDNRDDGFMGQLVVFLKESGDLTGKLPPIRVDDEGLLFYDVFLLINLVVSISFWVVHRMDLAFIGVAFNEGCLLSILWIIAGLHKGAFLFSALDGHATSDGDSRGSSGGGGPKAAGLLACHIFINTACLRVLFALAVAVAQHREVGSSGGEQLLLLEVSFGMLLMPLWRALHASYVPRI